MILGALGRAIYWTIGGIQAVGEVVGTVSRLVRQMRKGVVPHVDDSDPIPLTRRSSENIEGQIRSATGSGVRTGPTPTARDKG